uniref:DUF8040 domain-containing protein n=1 Tax=Vitis vinifera TaxID=29760 RepID=A5B292_VITVI|nr:hypothetical protein VITISV_007656 [Vitis vinifera]
MTTEITDVENTGTWRGNIEKIFIDIMAHPNAKRFCLKEYLNYNLLGLIFNPSTTTDALHYSSTQDPPNTDDEDEMDDNLEHGGVYVDVDTEILDDPLRPEMDTQLVTVEEAVAMFLLIVGHNVRMRVVVDRFQHFIETVARHFKEVRHALCRLGKILICPSNMTNEMSSYVASNPKYFPWFKDCIGAIDGTHSSAWVLIDKQTRFRGRKTVITQNVEGTTNDACVFLDALTRLEVNFSWPSEGKKYEVEDLSVQGEEESTSSTNHSIDLSDESVSAMTAYRDQIAQEHPHCFIWVDKYNLQQPQLVVDL